MSGMAYNSLRAGKRYFLRNYDDRHEFEILEILFPQDFLVKDLHTLEIYHMSDLTRYGISRDFEIRELR